MTKTDALVRKFSDLNVWRRGDERAPHKPLLVLYALARIQSGADRLIPFDRLEGPLERLLQEFGPPRKSPHPELPFFHLQTDGLWEIDERVPLRRRMGSRNFLRTELRKFRIAGGFPAPVFEELKRRPEAIREVAREEEGDGAGYDVLSFDDLSQPRLIEVKTTNGSARPPFYLSRNECEVASQKPDQWRIIGCTSLHRNRVSSRLHPRWIEHCGCGQRFGERRIDGYRDSLRAPEKGRIECQKRVTRLKFGGVRMTTSQSASRSHRWRPAWGITPSSKMLETASTVLISDDNRASRFQRLAPAAP